jgi:hypothetical protein
MPKPTDLYSPALQSRLDATALDEPIRWDAHRWESIPDEPISFILTVQAEAALRHHRGGRVEEGIFARRPETVTLTLDAWERHRRVLREAHDMLELQASIIRRLDERIAELTEQVCTCADSDPIPP